MKNIAKFILYVILLVTVVALCLMISSCSFNDTFELYHDADRIVSIDIVDVGIVAMTQCDIRASYPVADIEAFLNDFFKMECFVSYPPSDVQDNSRMIRITYDNGKYELIDRWNTVRYMPENEFPFSHQTARQFHEEEYNALIEKYSPSPDFGDVTEYTFMHSESKIRNIELTTVKYSHEPDFPIEEIESHAISDINSFLTDFRNLECRQGGWTKWDESLEQPTQVVKITYENEEYEYISAQGYLRHREEYVALYNGGQVEKTYLSGEDCKCFDKVQFEALIEKYSK